MSMPPAFWTLHDGLDRQGPGTPEDVAWAVAEAGAGRATRILDAGCGAGADIAALSAACPAARIVAVDGHPAFIERVRARAPSGRVDAVVGDMAKVAGPFDFVWCAGALYFLGITEGLRIFRDKIAPGGSMAFSEPVWTVSAPSPGAVESWADYPAITDLAGLETRVQQAGFAVRAVRMLTPEAWAAYYDPMTERIAALRPGADAALTEVLDAGQAEAQAWRNYGDEFTYALMLVRPQ